MKFLMVMFTDLEDTNIKIKKLKREHSCLVMEDNTLIIRIPYRLERMYIAYLAKLREEEIDH